MLTALLAAAFLLRVVGLGDVPLRGDEAFAVRYWADAPATVVHDLAHWGRTRGISQLLGVEVHRGGGSSPCVPVPAGRLARRGRDGGIGRTLLRSRRAAGRAAWLRCTPS